MTITLETPILADHAPDAAAMAATIAGAEVGLSAIPRIAEPEEITRLALSSPPTRQASQTAPRSFANGSLLVPVAELQPARAT